MLPLSCHCVSCSICPLATSSLFFPFHSWLRGERVTTVVIWLWRERAARSASRQSERKWIFLAALFTASLAYSECDDYSIASHRCVSCKHCVLEHRLRHCSTWTPLIAAALDVPGCFHVTRWSSEISIPKITHIHLVKLYYGALSFGLGILLPS